MQHTFHSTEMLGDSFFSGSKRQIPCSENESSLQGMPGTRVLTQEQNVSLFFLLLFLLLSTRLLWLVVLFLADCADIDSCFWHLFSGTSCKLPLSSSIISLISSCSSAEWFILFLLFYNFFLFIRRWSLSFLVQNQLRLSGKILVFFLSSVRA